MKPRRRCLGALLAAVLIGAVPACHAKADDAAWPARPLTILIPFPPGGAADLIGRLVASELGERLGQPVVADNRPGAGTAIAGDLAARAAPDGYTLSLATTGQLAILPALRQDLSYDSLRDFRPVGLVAEVPTVVSVKASSPDRSLQDLVRRASQPGADFSYSSCGIGTACHLTGELLNRVTGLGLVHVPFSGSAPAIQAVLGGHVEVAVDTATVQAPFIRSGALVPLVISTTARSAALPQIPTGAEAGYPDFVASSWFGVVVPAKTPDAIVGRLNAELQDILASDRVRATFAEQNLTPLGGTPQAFDAQIRQDLDKWRGVVRQAGIRLE